MKSGRNRRSGPAEPPSAETGRPCSGLPAAQFGRQPGRSVDLVFSLEIAADVEVAPGLGHIVEAKDAPASGSQVAEHRQG